MISSKTHEIISIPRFTDPIEAYKEVIIEKNMDYLVNSDMSIKFIQKTGEEWRAKLNYAWFVACGFLPYSESIKKEYLPTIDYANQLNFVFDETIYACSDKKQRDIIFDYELNPICPNCNRYHEESGVLLRLGSLWADFPIFADLDTFGKNLGMIMKQITKINYQHARLRSTEK